ncbi:sporulation protein [Ectobacillus polymachus]|uniref:sporulation protein n=1 Tax=Ectobacillus polymachus TaxID=1508806 RepID=UPI003A85634D
MLDKFMAKLGKGAADVYLQLPEDTFHLGEIVSGSVIVKGGKVEQHINNIKLELYRGFSNLTMGEQLLISAVPVVKESFVIAPHETKTFPFTITLPTEMDWDDEHEFYFVTNLDIDAGKDDHQKTVITLLPPSM